MARLPNAKARLIVNVMEHGAVVGTDDPVDSNSRTASTP